MPDGVIEALKLIREKIGYQAFVVLVLSFIAATFAQRLNDDVPGALRASCWVIAGGMFAVGILMALLQLSMPLFKHRPARGLIDGLAAGVLSGVVGGYLGFGFHHTSEYVDPTFARVGLCILFATPVGGVLGLAFDLFQPDRPIPWRTYLGVILLSFMFLFAVVGFGLRWFIPTMRGHGITVSDLQLLFESFLVFSVGIAAIQFVWPARQVLQRLPVLIGGIILARCATFIMPYIAAPGSSCTHFYCSEFVGDANGRASLAATVIALMTWAICTYGVLVKGHGLNRLLARGYGDSTSRRQS